MQIIKGNNVDVNKLIFGLDRYEINAVFLPALTNLVLMGLTCSSVINIDRLPPIATYISISLIILVLLRFCMNAFREISKLIMEKIWQDKTPTTSYLIDDTICSKVMRKAIFARIKKDFNLSIPLRSSTNQKERIKLICEATALIRDYVRKHNLSVVYSQYNERYGAVRNFIGGFCCTFVFEIVCIIIYYCIYSQLLPLSIILAALHFLIAFICALLIPTLGRRYAEILYVSYLNS